MNLSLQISRAALGVIGLVAACAFAQSGVDADAPAVAHNRVEIVNVADAKDAQHAFAVASVHVGAPQASAPERRVAARIRTAANHG